MLARSGERRNWGASPNHLTSLQRLETWHHSPPVVSTAWKRRVTDLSVLHPERRTRERGGPSVLGRAGSGGEGGGRLARERRGRRGGRGSAPASVGARGRSLGRQLLSTSPSLSPTPHFIPPHHSSTTTRSYLTPNVAR